jgi:hypothetical protein
MDVVIQCHHFSPPLTGERIETYSRVLIKTMRVAYFRRSDSDLWTSFVVCATATGGVATDQRHSLIIHRGNPALQTW